MASDDDAALTIRVPEWATAIERFRAPEWRHQLGDDGSTSANTRSIRIIDLETTGLGPSDEVIEVAAIDLNCDSGEICAFGSEIIRPRNPIPPQASAVHHITDADVANAPIWEEVWPHFFNGDGNIVAFAAHNASFEGKWLSDKIGHRPLICTYKAALRIWPDAPGHTNQILRYWLKLPLEADRGFPHTAHCRMLTLPHTSCAHS
jgi:exodeoxyribonuclease X